MPPHFFSQGLRLSSAAYMKLLETVVKHRIDSPRGDNPYIFQQLQIIRKTTTKRANDHFRIFGHLCIVIEQCLKMKLIDKE